MAEVARGAGLIVATRIPIVSDRPGSGLGSHTSFDIENNPVELTRRSGEALRRDRYDSESALHSKLRGEIGNCCSFSPKAQHVAIRSPIGREDVSCSALRLALQVNHVTANGDQFADVDEHACGDRQSLWLSPSKPGICLHLPLCLSPILVVRRWAAISLVVDDDLEVLRQLRAGSYDSIPDHVPNGNGV